ncbi:MAG: 4-hydroxybutyrate dehydrogenase [Tissierellia bacterium]|jgi:4-hydroxybutyrate dehydrogenase|nr:4-hydroxybutyrate dehydrogenase [Tissierellia bacterium]
MKELVVMPTIYKYLSSKDFAKDFKLGKDDLVIVSEKTYKQYFEHLNLECNVIYKRQYGSGEPSDDMVEAIYKDIKNDFNRVVAIGGGGVLDIAKLLALKDVTPVTDLFDGKIKVKKEKNLILVPTTCGTGSEVTNISILALKDRGTKKGLASDEMFADSAVLIPELLNDLPFNVFATSSIDALIHAVESNLSPKSSFTTKLFGYKAIEIILEGYKKITAEGIEARIPLLEDFLIASTYAGIAFGNAGCAAVHALSYPLGATYHVPHGESNYLMFTEVMKNYMEIRADGEIAVLNRFIADILNCEIVYVYEELEKLLNNIIPKKKLREYGMTETKIMEFTESVLANQGRLLANNYVELDKNRIYKIYRELY